MQGEQMSMVHNYGGSHSARTVSVGWANELCKCLCVCICVLLSL